MNPLFTMDLSRYTKREIPLQELPQWSPWPERLLQLKEWKTQERNVEKIDREYDKDKYLRCLEFAKEQGTDVSPGVVRAFELGLERSKGFCVSQKGKLYEVPPEKMIECNEDVLLSAVTPFMKDIDIVVEIGCGYGTNLWELHKKFPDKKYKGGEYSGNAIALAKMLYADIPAIDVQFCNFYDDAYQVLEDCPSDSRVLFFTRHAIEQLPTAAPLFKTLTKYFDRIHTGILLEVVMENYGNTLLDMLRRSYIAANDYNRDVLSVLTQNPKVELLHNDPDIFGLNAFNPTSALVWRPK